VLLPVADVVVLLVALMPEVSIIEFGFSQWEFPVGPDPLWLAPEKRERNSMATKSTSKVPINAKPIPIATNGNSSILPFLAPIPIKKGIKN